MERLKMNVGYGPILSKIIELKGNLEKLLD